ncbi:hypothetical protein IWQ52_004472 [Labrenzia sp. EL_159]|nr:hypothetical protein [Labrenzia sp. EL_162]MBG6196936.1 hypothetical protein [Labrenzia sp. EL_159]
MTLGWQPANSNVCPAKNRSASSLMCVLKGSRRIGNHMHFQQPEQTTAMFPAIKLKP